jgi:hypothetical protein
MSAYLTVLWILGGWCGSVPLILIFPRPRHPDPEPPPQPEWSTWITLRIIGAVTGVIGGWAFVQAFGPHPEPWLAADNPVPWAATVFAAATAVFAFIVSRVVTDVYQQLRG